MRMRTKVAGIVWLLACVWGVPQSEARVSHTQLEMQRHRLHRAQRGGEFAPSGTTPKYPRSRSYRLTHLKLVLTILPRKGSVDGTAFLTISPWSRTLSFADFDAAELDIKQVSAGDKRLSWRLRKERLRVTLAQALKPGESTTIAIRYRATPRFGNGLTFVKPNKEQPNKPLVVWSQGETQQNRYWFPSYDTPNMRFTSETIITVPKPLMVIANGALVKRTESAKMVTFHHQMKHNHVNYLVSLVIGEFVLYRQQWNGIPILNYVSPVDKDKAKRSFENTADMMAFFSKKTGFRYPYPRYVQVTVPDYTHGGMENITASTLTRYTLHDARAHLNWRSDGLVAHELAHQWFGDLMTCKDWSHIWLNESFATYFDKLYQEHKWGKQEFDYARMSASRWYFGSSYFRPIQTRVYQSPGDVFDAHAYPKGAAVLHMIRTRLGDALWWRAIQHYTKNNAHRLVETSDLRRSIEAVSGQSWLRFFDQWVRRAGHPTIKMSWSHSPTRKALTIKIRQKQKSKPWPIRAKIRVSWKVKAAAKLGATSRPSVKAKPSGVVLRRETLILDLNKRAHTFVFSSAKAPALVEFDPDNDILMRYQADKGAEAWLFQLVHGSAYMSRWRAARRLGKFHNKPKVVSGLAAVVMDASLHHAIRAEAAQSLGRIHSNTACAVLKNAVRVKEAKVRSFVVQALGHCKDTPASLFAALIKKDPSYEVHKDALYSVLRRRYKNAFALISSVLDNHENYGRTQDAAIRALIVLQNKAAIPLCRKMMSAKYAYRARRGAMLCYAKLTRLFKKKPHEKHWRAIAVHLNDGYARIRSAAVEALVQLGDVRAIPRLRAYARLQPDPGDGEIKKMEIKIARLRSRSSLRSEIRRLNKRFFEVRRGIDGLKRRMKRLERKPQKIRELRK